MSGLVDPWITVPLHRAFMASRISSTRFSASPRTRMSAPASKAGSGTEDTYGPPQTTNLPRTFASRTRDKRLRLCNNIPDIRTVSAHCQSPSETVAQLRSTRRTSQSAGRKAATVRSPSGGVNDFTPMIWQLRGKDINESGNSGFKRSNFMLVLSYAAHNPEGIWLP